MLYFIGVIFCICLVLWLVYRAIKGFLEPRVPPWSKLLSVAVMIAGGGMAAVDLYSFAGWLVLAGGAAIVGIADDVVHGRYNPDGGYLGGGGP